jgi:uncharacterized protein
MEKLDPDDTDSFSLKRKILEEGFVENYGEIFNWLSEEVSEELTKEVWDILQMYRSLNFSYHNLENNEAVNKDELKFRGFDGNDETNYMVYAKFVLHDLDRYKELWDDGKFPDYNTHSSSLPKYRRMLSVWGAMSDRYNNNLTAEQISEIINA